MVKYLFQCPCGTIGGDLHDNEPGTLHVCPHCERALVVEAHRPTPMRYATKEEIAADEERFQRVMDEWQAMYAKLKKWDH